jgi:hypothetical protein
MYRLPIHYPAHAYTKTTSKSFRLLSLRLAQTIITPSTAQAGVPDTAEVSTWPSDAKPQADVPIRNVG